jgi:hypothetical protein
MRIDGEAMRSYLPTINEIMFRNSFQKSQFELKMALISTPSYHEGGPKRLALLIGIDQGDHIMTSTWVAARDEILRLLASEGLSQVDVEMIDRNRAFMPLMFPLRPEDTSIIAYQVA